VQTADRWLGQKKVSCCRDRYFKGWTIVLTVKYSIVLWTVQDMKVGNTYSLSVIKYSMLFDTLLWRHVYEASSCLPISIFMTAFSHIATGTHMPYGITRCYLPPDRADIYPSRSWYLIKRSWNDARLSWPSLLLSLRVKKKLKSVNIWQSYKQERGCLMHFAHLANTLLNDEESARDYHQSNLLATADYNRTEQIYMAWNDVT